MITGEPFQFFFLLDGSLCLLYLFSYFWLLKFKIFIAWKYELVTHWSLYILLHFLSFYDGRWWPFGGLFDVASFIVEYYHKFLYIFWWICWILSQFRISVSTQTWILIWKLWTVMLISSSIIKWWVRFQFYWSSFLW